MEWKEIEISNLSKRVKVGFVGTCNSSYTTKESGVPMIRTGDLKDQGIDYSSLKYVTKEFHAQNKKSQLHKDDILIARHGDNGKACIYDSDQEANCLNVVIIEPDPLKVDARFLYYAINCPYNQARLKSTTVGSVQSVVNTKVVSSFILRVPSSIDDQRRISSILSSLDRKIELNNKINATLEEMAQALFKTWFVDFEPFKNGNFIDTEIGKIPEGWRVGSVYEYVKVIYGAPYKSKLFNDKGEGLPLIRIRDLKDCSPQFFTEEILPNTEYIVRGDIVAGMDAEFTPHIWKGEKGLLNQRVCKLKPAVDGVSNLFALYLLKPHLEFTQSYKTGTTVSHLGKGDIDRFVAVLPPLDVVVNLSKRLDAILKRICSLSQETLTLTHLRDTLLPRLMSGEIEV